MGRRDLRIEELPMEEIKLSIVAEAEVVPAQKEDDE